ncbi:MAG: hypothetical protein AB7O93_19610 [Vicinamibacterales bacterium]
MRRRWHLTGGMTAGPLLFAWAFGAAALAQAPVPAAMPASLQGHLRAERLQDVTSVRGLPLGVRDALQALFGASTLAIAEPGARFQATDVVEDPGLPARRLVLAGCGPDHCVVYYERGGFAHTWRAVLFHWTPTGTTAVAGGVAPRDLRSIDDVRNALLSGTVRAAGRDW